MAQQPVQPGPTSPVTAGETPNTPPTPGATASLAGKSGPPARDPAPRSGAAVNGPLRAAGAVHGDPDPAQIAARHAALIACLMQVYAVSGRKLPDPIAERDMSQALLAGWDAALIRIPVSRLLEAVGAALADWRGNFLLTPGDVLIAWDRIVEQERHTLSPVPMLPAGPPDYTVLRLIGVLRDYAHHQGWHPAPAAIIQAALDLKQLGYHAESVSFLLKQSDGTSLSSPDDIRFLLALGNAGEKTSTFIEEVVAIVHKLQG